MPSLRFTHDHVEHELVFPADELSEAVVREVLAGISYPFPGNGEPRVIVDVGAHVGAFTLMSALRMPGATIHAFEPHGPTCELLRQNTRAHANVIVHQQAVAPSAGKARLFLSEHGSPCSTLLGERVLKPTGKSVEIETVGPDVIAALKPDILKLDCEGLEIACLEGMGADAYRGIDLIYLEFHCEADRRLADHLLTPTHTLNHARISQCHLGDLGYLHRRPRTIKRLD